MGLGRPILVFRREAAAKQADSASNVAGKAISFIRPGNWIYQLAMHASITTAHAHT